MKAYEQPSMAITLTPTASFLDKQYTFVTVDASGNMVNSAAGATACGVTQTPGIAGEPCNVMVHGVSFIKLGGTIASGAEVEVGANGAAVVLSTGKAVATCLVGGVAGEIGCVLLK